MSATTALLQSASGIAMWHSPDALNSVTRFLLTVAFLASAYAATYWVIRVPYFALRDVQFGSPLQHVTPEQIEAIVARDLNGTFFTLDLETVRASFEKLPWVRAATVRRVWPDQLQIGLEEHAPLARWGSAALVNTRGEIFGAAYDGRLPLFVGPESSVREIAIQYTFFKRSLSAISEVPIQVHVSARRAWQLRLESGLTLELGRDRIEPRLERFIALYDRTIRPLGRKLEYIDLRYPNGFALRIPELREEAPAKRRTQAANVKRAR